MVVKSDELEVKIDLEKASSNFEGYWTINQVDNARDMTEEEKIVFTTKMQKMQEVFNKLGIMMDDIKNPFFNTPDENDKKHDLKDCTIFGAGIKIHFF